MRAPLGGPNRDLALPYGPFDPERHRTFEIGVREWVERQTHVTLGYVEQLYTFGDKGREAPVAALSDEHGERVVSVGYLALAPSPAELLTEDALWADWYSFFPWEDWRTGEELPMRDWIEACWRGCQPTARAHGFEERLAPIVGLVDDLSVSSDAYHGSEDGVTCPDIARSVARKLGIPVDFISVAAPESTEVAGAAGKLPPGESAVLFRGRAAEKLASRVAAKPCETFDTCPWEDLREPERVHVDPIEAVARFHPPAAQAFSPTHTGVWLTELRGRTTIADRFAAGRSSRSEERFSRNAETGV